MVVLEVVLVAPALDGESAFELCVARDRTCAPVKGVHHALEDVVSSIQSERNRECR